MRRIAGLHSQGIADVLGHTFGDEVIHRNNLVLLSAAEDEVGIR